METTNLYSNEKYSLSNFAEFGDSFGFITSFFSALGTIFLVLTILLQYKTLVAQKEELKETRDEVKGQRLELEGQKKLMEKQTAILEDQKKHAFFHTFLTEHQKHSDLVSDDLSKIYSYYNSFQFDQMHNLIESKRVKNHLLLIERNLENIGEHSDFFYSTLSDNQADALTIASLSRPDLYPKILDLVTRLTSDRHLKDQLNAKKIRRVWLEIIGIKSINESLEKIHNAIIEHQNNHIKHSSPKYIKSQIDNIKNDIDKLEFKIGEQISEYSTTYILKKSKSNYSLEFADKLDEIKNITSIIKNSRIAKINEILDEIPLNDLYLKDTKSKTESYIDKNFFKSDLISNQH